MTERGCVDVAGDEDGEIWLMRGNAANYSLRVTKDENDMTTTTRQKPLRDIEETILSFVRSTYATNGIAPSIREICNHLPDNPSTSVVQYNLESLITRGLLRYAGTGRGQARSIVPADAGSASAQEIIARMVACLADGEDPRQTLRDLAVTTLSPFQSNVLTQLSRRYPIKAYPAAIAVVLGAATDDVQTALIRLRDLGLARNAYGKMWEAIL